MSEVTKSITPLTNKYYSQIMCVDHYQVMNMVNSIEIVWYSGESPHMRKNFCQNVLPQKKFPQN